MHLNLLRESQGSCELAAPAVRAGNDLSTTHGINRTRVWGLGVAQDEGENQYQSTMIC